MCQQQNHTMIKAFRLFLAIALPVAAMVLLMAVLAGPRVPVVHAASTITVNTTDDEYDAAPNATCSLREAITTINGGANFGGCTGYGTAPHTINVLAGTYTLTRTGRLEENTATGDLDITASVIIQGAGSGATIIQAGTNATNGIDRVFHIPSPDGDGVTVTFNDMTIRYGLLPGDEDGIVDDGAAIHNETGATVNINDCIITQNTVADGGNDAAIANQGLDGGGTININNCTISYNSSDDDGGGVFNKQQVDGTSTISITNSTIISNTTPHMGGGVYNEGGAVTVISSTISYNEASAVDGHGDGGGIANFSGGTLVISGTTFFGNETENKGSAIWNEEVGTNLDVQNCVFDGNIATGDGTVACYEGATCTISTSTFSDNTAVNTGAGLYVSDGADTDTQATVTTSTFSGNTAAEDGGGIYVSGSSSTVTLTNVTISGNEANDDGGGIFTTGGPTLTVIHSTIADNAADADNTNGGAGGGLDISSTGSHTLKNTIVAGNTADVGDNCADTITNGGYNIDSGTTCGWGSVNDSMSDTDPLLDPLANNGGPTETRALQVGSPAIDQISYETNGCGTTYTTDQRSYNRPEPAGGSCDIGAYEYDAGPSVVTLARFVARSVGNGSGIVVPVNRLELAAPWMGLAALAGFAALGVVVVRRRRG